MSEERRDEKLARQAREAFDQSVAGLDGQTRSRLARARAAALEAGRSRGTFWLPASGMRLGLTGALAAAALAVVVIVQAPRPASEVEIMAFDDIEILLGEEDLELFEELEFYAWIEEQPELEEFLDEADNTG